MKNVVCWDIKKNSVRTSQETHYVSSTESSRLCYVRFEVFAVVTMRNAVFWDVTPCDSDFNRNEFREHSGDSRTSGRSGPKSENLTAIW
jgi:hypothetical protein